MLTLVLVPPAPALAQTTGQVTGRVMSAETGEPLEGAVVEVRGNPLGAYTGRDGRFLIVNVSPGLREVTARLIGYRTVTMKDVRVRVDHIAQVEFRLESAPIELPGQVVEAEREPLLIKEQTASRQIISREEIRALPVDNIDELLSLQAGVINGTIRGGRIGQETYVIDGVPVKNFFEGSQEGLGLDISTAALQELALVSNGFSAEFGQALSGVINVVTRDGGEAFGGSLRATSDAPFPEGTDYGYDRMELSVGGPLPLPGERTGKATYFLTADLTGQGDADPVAARLLLPGGDDQGFLPHNEGDIYRLLGKVRYQLSDQAALTGSLLRSREQRRFYDPRYKFNPEGALAQRTVGELLTVGLRKVATPSVERSSIWDTRVSLYRNRRYLGALEEGSFEERSDLFGFGLSDYRFRGEEFILSDPAAQRRAGGAVPGYEGPAADGSNPYGVVDAGVLIDSGENPFVARTLYEFAGIKSDWENQLSTDFNVKIGGEAKLNHAEALQRINAHQPGGMPNYVEFFPVVAAGYLQSQIREPGITLNVGLRVDAFFPRIRFPENRILPGLGLRDATNKYAANPRLGAAIPISENDLLRINYGVFRETPDFQFLFDVAFDDTTRQGNRRLGNPELSYEKTTQYEFTYTRLLEADVALTGSVFVKQLENLTASRSAAGGMPQQALFTNDDFGSVKGVEVVLDKRMSRYVGLKVNYSWQRAVGMVSSAFDIFGRPIIDPVTGELLEADRMEFPLDFDQRHTGNAVLQLWTPEEFGPRLAGRRPLERLSVLSTWEYGSGLPFTRTDAAKSPIEDANSSRLPVTFTWDLKLRRDISLRGSPASLFCDIRNLTGRANVLFVRPETGTVNADHDRLVQRAQEATERAIPIPVESPDYWPQQDLDRDGVATPQEQYASYLAALEDVTQPILYYGEPRQVRLGMQVEF